MDNGFASKECVAVGVSFLSTPLQTAFTPKLEPVGDVGLGENERLARDADDALVRAAAGAGRQPSRRLGDVSADHGKVAAGKFKDVRATGAASLRSETKTRRVANLLTITANYREVWKEFFHSAELIRLIDPSADVVKKPVTPAEKYFVNMIISHTSSMYEALKDELVTKQDGLRRDVGSFLSLPIPQAVWEKTKVFQNADFVAFVGKCRRGPSL